MKIWIHGMYATHAGIRSLEMIQATLRGCVSRRPRLKRLFMNKTNAKLMRWHKEECKQDNMLRHPADGSLWRKMDRTFPTFANDARNIRLGLSTDGMNPFGEQSSGHSTWPVTLCIYNLPPVAIVPGL